MTAKTTFPNWKEKVLSKVNENITKLKQKVKPNGEESVLNYPDVKRYLEQINLGVVIVIIEKNLITSLSFVNCST